MDTLEEQPTRLEINSVEASARLTGLTGLILMVGLFVEGLTLVSVHRLVVIHVLVGMLLIPMTTLKLASVAFRFISYYTGNAAFRKAGPPTLVLRLLGPLVVVSTVVLFASGIWLALAGPNTRTLAGALHKGSFVIWFGTMTIHVLGHLRDLPRFAFSDWLTRRKTIVVAFGYKMVPVRGSVGRTVVIAAALAIGVALMVLTKGLATPWHHYAKGTSG